MRVFLKGLNGCVTRKQKLLQYQEYLKRNNHMVVQSPGEAEVIFIWACGFREDYQNNSLDEIKRYEKQYPGARVIIGGCLPNISPSKFKAGYRGMVIPWRDEQRLEEVFGSGLTSRSSPVFVEPRLTDNIPEYQRLHPDALVMFFDQYIKVVVSEGCRYQCRYCSERLAFPPYHSFPEDEIVTRVHDVVDATGVRDVILIADDLGGYGLDGGSNLVSLIRRIVSSSGVRVALNNMNPADFIVHYNELWELIKSHKICHVNLPIQSASNRVLELMNRTYRLKDIERVFSLFNLYGFRDFDTHVIIGFYGEMKQDFDETVDFIVRHHPRYVLASGFMEPDGFICQLGARVPEFVKQRRLRVFARVMEENRIICNVDNGRLSSERFRRMNAV